MIYFRENMQLLSDYYGKTELGRNIGVDRTTIIALLKNEMLDNDANDRRYNKYKDFFKSLFPFLDPQHDRLSDYYTAKNIGEAILRIKRGEKYMEWANNYYCQSTVYDMSYED